MHGVCTKKYLHYQGFEYLSQHHLDQQGPLQPGLKQGPQHFVLYHMSTKNHKRHFYHLNRTKWKLPHVSNNRRSNNQKSGFPKASSQCLIIQFIGNGAVSSPPAGWQKERHESHAKVLQLEIENQALQLIFQLI